MIETTNPMELVQRGQAAARVGRQAEALALLRRAVEIAPQSPEAWLALAGVEDDPQSKIACFEKVLALDPENVEARLGLEMLQPDEAEDDLETVLAEASRRLEEAVGPPPPGVVPLDDDVLYCANHPNVETGLRCNRCGKPICPRCAVQTEVGYRCRECLGRQRARYYTGGGIDYVIGGVAALLLGGFASFIMGLLGAWFFALILGPAAGIGIAEVVRLAVRRRQSQYLWLAVSGGFVIGSLPALLLALLGLNLWTLLTLGLFLVLAVGAAAARLR
jgi:tetratricopeptide (TPR) repeat protein